MNSAEIGTLYGMSANAVRRRRGKAESTRTEPPTREELSAMWQQGMTDDQIGLKFGRHASTAKSWRMRYGLVQKRYLPSRNELGALWSEGLADKEIGARYGVAAGTVKQWRLRHRLIRASRPSREEIQACLEEGLSDKAIGQRYGAMPETVRAWRSQFGLLRISRSKPCSPTLERLIKLLDSHQGRPEPEILKQLVHSGATNRTLAQIFQVPQSRAKQWLADADIRRSMSRRPSDSDLLQRVNIGESDQSIAEQLGVAEGTVIRWRLELGIQRPRSWRRPNPASAAEILQQLVSAGMSDKEIADRFQVKCSTAATWRRAAGISRKKVKAPDLRQRRVRVTKPPEDELPRLFSTGWTMRQVAEKFGVSPSTVGKWRSDLGIARRSEVDRKIRAADSGE